VRARAQRKHIHIHHALYELKEAKLELKEAAMISADTASGPRGREAAIVQIDKALTGADDKFMPSRSKRTSTKKYEHHPHIQRAISGAGAARCSSRKPSTILAAIARRL